MNPLVSIVIPCFNAAKYLREAVASALAQTYQPVEVIVVDDGSTDGSIEIARQFGKQIRLEVQSHQGAPVARNRGLSFAAGEFVQFLDADDMLLLDKLQKQVPVACQHPDSITFTEYFLESESDGSRQLMRMPEAGDDPVHFALNAIPLTTGPLHRKDRLQAVAGFREDLECSQDYDLLLRLACAGSRFERIPEPLWVHRRLSGSVSSCMLKVLDQCQRVHDAIMHQIFTDGSMSGKLRADFAGKMARDARHYLKLGQRHKGLDLLKRACALDSRAAIQRGYPTAKSRCLFRMLGPVLTEKLTVMVRASKGRNARLCRT